MVKSRSMRADTSFIEALDRMVEKIEKKRGRRPSHPELTAELARKDFEEIMFYILEGKR
jgi:hypothetical protein